MNPASPVSRESSQLHSPYVAKSKVAEAPSNSVNSVSSRPLTANAAAAPIAAHALTAHVKTAQGTVQGLYLRARDASGVHFPLTVEGKARMRKIALCNSSTSKITVILPVLPLPFSIRPAHQQIEIQGRSYVNLPLYYAPSVSGRQSHQVAIAWRPSASQTTHNDHTLLVKMEGHAQASPLRILPRELFFGGESLYDDGGVEGVVVCTMLVENIDDALQIVKMSSPCHELQFATEVEIDPGQVYPWKVTWTGDAEGMEKPAFGSMTTLTVVTNGCTETVQVVFDGS